MIRWLSLLLLLCCGILGTAAEDAGQLPVAIQEGEADAHSVTAFDLKLTLPTDWEKAATISPRILCWRGPAIDSEQHNSAATQDAQPSITITRPTNDADSSIAETIEALKETILDLYSNGEIVAMATDTDNVYGYPFIEVRFDIGPVRWQQVLIFIESPLAIAQSANTVILSSSARSWPDWQSQRQDLISSFTLTDIPQGAESTEP